MDFGSGWPLDGSGHPVNPDSWTPKRSARLPVAPWPEHLLAKASPQALRELESLGVGDIVKHGMTRSAASSAPNSGEESDSDSSLSDAPSPTPEAKAAAEAEAKAAAARAARLARRRSGQWEQEEQLDEPASSPSPAPASAGKQRSSLASALSSAAEGEEAKSAAAAPKAASQEADSKSATGKQSKSLAATTDAPASQQEAAPSKPARGTKRSRAAPKAGAASTPKVSKRRGAAKSDTATASSVPAHSTQNAAAAQVPSSPKAQRSGLSSDSSSRGSLAAEAAGAALLSGAQPSAGPATDAITPVDLLQWLFPKTRQQPPVHAPAAAAAAAVEGAAAGNAASAPLSDEGEESTLLSLRPFACPTFPHVTQVAQRTSSSGAPAAVVTGFTSTSTTPTPARVDERWQALCNQQAATRIICELHGRLLAMQYHRGQAAAAVGNGSQQQRATAAAAAARYQAGEQLIVKHMKQQLHLIPVRLREAFAAVCSGEDPPPTPPARPATSNDGGARAAPPPGSVRSYSGSVASHQSAAVSVAQTGGRPMRRTAAVLAPTTRAPAVPMQSAVYSTNAPLTSYTGESSQPFPPAAAPWMGGGQAVQYQGVPQQQQQQATFMHPGYEQAGYVQSGGYAHSGGYPAPFVGGGFGYPTAEGYATAGAAQPAGVPPSGYGQGNAYPQPSHIGLSYMAYMKGRGQGWGGQ